MGRALSAVGEISSCLVNDLPDDLVATCLREAIHALGEITGETAGADMIERIFRDFCIGK
jgi:tRNA modification GTPase